MVCRIKGDEENKRDLAYRPKSSDRFLERLIFQGGGRAENQASEQWIVTQIRRSSTLPKGCGNVDLDELPKLRANKEY